MLILVSERLSVIEKCSMRVPPMPSSRMIKLRVSLRTLFGSAWYLCIAYASQAAVQGRCNRWRSGCVGVHIHEDCASHVIGCGVTVACSRGKLRRVPKINPTAPTQDIL